MIRALICYFKGHKWSHPFPKWEAKHETGWKFCERCYKAQYQSTVTPIERVK